MTAEIRNRFQEAFGDGGAGFIFSRNLFSTPRSNVRSAASSGWVVDGIGIKGATDGRYGLAGISLSTDSGGESTWIEAAAEHFEVHYLKQPGGASIDILLDEKSVLTKL